MGAGSGDRASAVVVGAGVFGASIAHALVGRAWSVEIVERNSPAHTRASSHDSSRLLRLGHGDEDLPDNWYTRSALRSRRLWTEIGEEEGVDLFVPSGALWLARTVAGYEERSRRDLGALGIPVERLAAADAVAFFPGVRHDDLAFVLHEPMAGVLRATACVHTLIRRALRGGATLRTGTARPDGGGVLVDSERLGCDRVIWACGPWLPRLFPGIRDLRSVKQAVFYFGAGARWRTPPVPAWIDDGGYGYGLGDLDGSGFKAVYAPPGRGLDLDPDAGDGLPDAGDLHLARALLAHRFPSLAAAPVVTATLCRYELTPDLHFVVAPTDETGRAWIVGGGSGHGFKHGPALGEYVADLLEDRERPRPAFGLGRRRQR